MSENKTAKTPTDDGHVAHVYLFEKTGRPMVAWDNAKDIKLGDRLYASPKQWVGLTDEEILECTIAAERNYAKHMQATRGQQLDQRDQLDWWIARYIESKLREKNT